MEDKELLAAAAKAAGIKGEYCAYGLWVLNENYEEEILNDENSVIGDYWNPLRDDVSALVGRVWDLKGDVTRITGVLGITGDVSGLTGDVSNLVGDCTGINGDCTGIWGDFYECFISDTDRANRSINISNLVIEE